MGLFGSFYKKKEPVLEPVDLSILQVDIHSHFIPGIDDGAKTIEDSIELISAMKDFGYRKVITTPHIMSDYYRNTPEIILGGLEKVRAALKENNIDIEVDAAVKEVIVNNGATVGVEMEDGTELYAPKIISNLNPKLLYTKLIASEHLSEDFNRRISGWVCASGTFRMNVALTELPDFTCLPGKEVSKHHSSSIIICPTMKYLDDAYLDARCDGWAKKPAIEMHIPSVVDDSLAPPGHHVASLFCQQFAPEIPDGRSWDDCKEEVADLIIDTINNYAPNFKQSIAGRMSLSPLDLERKIGLIGGDIFHGALNLNQMYSARPALGYGDYRGPLKGLYMCGSGTHPGGGVTGIPGHNAAREILRD